KLPLGHDSAAQVSGSDLSGLIAEACRERSGAAGTFALSPEILKGLALIIRANEARHAQIVVPSSPLSALGVVVGDRAWQIAVMPCVSEESERAGGAS
ncbi:MAG: hypothetical protein ACRC4O_07105, partial [Giesbergeria sp.]